MFTSSLALRLEKDGLVERRTDAGDRRRFEVALTDNGRRVVKQNFGPFYGAMLRATQTVSPGDRLVMLQGLRTFRRALDGPEAPTTDDTDV